MRRNAIRDAVIERCLPLAEHIARRYASRGESLDDLIQIARVGLVNAIDRFEPDRGTNFLSFAVPTVSGEVRRHFRDAMWAMRVPRRMKEVSLDIGKANDELVQRLGRSPRPSEISEFLGIGVDEVVDGLVARSAYSASSIDAQPEHGEGRSIRDTLGEDDDRIAQIDDFVSLRPALDNLPQRERDILSLRFFQSMSQSEIAVRLGISQMHVSRLLARTLAQLRAEITSETASRAADQS